MAVDLGEGLRAWAETVPALTALIGDGAEMRFEPWSAVETPACPYVIYLDAKDAEAARHEAPAAAATSRVSFTCVASDPPGCKALEQALYAALMTPQRFSGLMGAVTVQAVLYESSSPMPFEWEEEQWALDVEFKFCYNL